MKKLILFFSACLILSSCAAGKDYVRPQTDLPDGVSYVVSDKWWENFNDEILNKLIRKALAHNQDLRLAIARVNEARAIAGITDAARMPAAGVSADGSNTNNRESYSLSAGISYELDLWGKYKRLSESKRAQLLASQASMDTVIIALTADVARTYFALRSNDAQLVIAQHTFTSRAQTVDIYQKRLAAGLVSNLDMQRVIAEMYSVETSVQGIKKAIGETETALSVLIGANPREITGGNIERGEEIENIVVIPGIPEGIPSNLLERRPDIMQAEQMLISANAEIGAARAAFFPSITLTAGYGYASSSLANLFTNGIWNFAGSLAQPVFQGGKLKSQEKQAQAKYDQMLAAYNKTIQVAFKETLDALNANKINRETVTSIENQRESLQQVYSIAFQKHEAGLIGFLDVLDAERSFLSVELSYIKAIQNQLNAIVDVHKALGGGWSKLTLREKERSDPME
ncbi:MAG: efflux transporter outer membrane subunit [Endomicrobia bacterium]|nr:efflux transporter outer membrane subunit [Endomicrobiia bacterium]MCL2506277.1 efflux transporter outer membrane subunit [Endomicrobiia bacterium]